MQSQEFSNGFVPQPGPKDKKKIKPDSEIERAKAEP